MRPYLAVLKDSFREALASRVLWIVLIITTAVLVLAAPSGLKEEKTAYLRLNSVRRWPELVAKIEAERRLEGPSPARQIWARWSTSLKELLAASERESPGEISGELAAQIVDELNGILSDRTFYDPAAWQGREPGDEARQLLKGGVATLGDEQVKRLNRLLLEAAYPADISTEKGTAFYISYLTFKPIGPLPATRAQMTTLIKTVLAAIIDYAVGVFAVFAAILVTASIIPQTYEAGAIDLLLSKPVSRSLLFLTKFLGGCTFIGLIAGYFILGLWLIAGLRFEIWDGRLFLCVPILVFLFAIYYSVSALAGVLWRNAIVSVVVSIAFWSMCLGLWLVKNFVELRWIEPQRLVKLVPAGQTLLAVNSPGQVESWRARDSTWEEVFVSENPPPRAAGFIIPQQMTGPVYDVRHDRLVAIPAPPPAAGFSLFGPSATLAVGARKDAWTRKKGPAPPPGALALFVSPGGEVIVVTKTAIFRLSGGDKAGKPEDSPKPAGKEKFVRSGPEPALGLEPSAAAAIDPDTGAIAVFNRGIVTVLEANDSGKYTRKIEKEVVPSKEAAAGLIAIGGKSVMAALADGRVLILGADDLEARHEFRPEGDNAPRAVAASPGGHWFSVLFQKRVLWLYDIRQSRPARFSFTGQGDISAAVFDGPDRLLAADRGTRVTQYQLHPFQSENNRAPAMTGQEAGYYYGLLPIYTVFPKPGELGNVVKSLLKDKEKEPSLDAAPQALAQNHDEVDIAGPIWSSLAFLAVMLALSCLYVWRSDF